MNITDYMALDGVGLARLIARGEVSAREAAEAALKVIDARNLELNAVIMRHPDPLPPAAPCQETSALSGVPFLLKDANLYSADLPTTFGSAYFRGAPPRGDSIMVERWRKAGLTILGKTNTPEFAAEFVTEPRAYGATRICATSNSPSAAAAAVPGQPSPPGHGAPRPRHGSGRVDPDSHPAAVSSASSRPRASTRSGLFSPRSPAASIPTMW